MSRAEAAVATAIGAVLGCTIWRWFETKHREADDRPMIRVGNGSLRITVGNGKFKEKTATKWRHSAAGHSPRSFYVRASVKGDCGRYVAELSGVTVEIVYGYGSVARVLTVAIEEGNLGTDPTVGVPSDATLRIDPDYMGMTVDDDRDYLLESIITKDDKMNVTSRYDFPKDGDRTCHTVCIYPRR